MVNVVLDHHPLGVGDGLFNRLQLLSDIEAGPPGLQHCADAAQVPLGTPEPLDNGGMGLVNSIIGHVEFVPSGWRFPTTLTR